MRGPHQKTNKVMNVKILAPLLLSTLLVAQAFADEPAPPPDPAKVKFQWGVKIPLRDGVKLNATVYTPRDQKEPAPCVFTLTPYISQSYHDRGIYFAVTRLSVPDGRRARPRQLRGRVPAADPGSARRSRCSRVARAAAVLQRQGHDVGRLVRRLRPVGHGEGISAAPRDDCPGRLAVCRHRLPDARQHCVRRISCNG